MAANPKFLKTLRIIASKPAFNSRIRDEFLILLPVLRIIFRSLALVPAMQEKLMTEDRRYASVFTGGRPQR